MKQEWPEACIVRGPDLLWGGDIRGWHVPVGKFDGVIGGPPCQAFSALRHMVKANGGKPRFGNLIPEFERVVAEAQPLWFLMENVPPAPIPVVDGYKVRSFLVKDGLVGGKTMRVRRFSFGTPQGLWLEIPCVVDCEQMTHAVTSDARSVPVRMLAGGYLKYSCLAGHGPAPGQRRTASPGHRQGLQSVVHSVAEMCEDQGLPGDFMDHAPFTMHGKRQVLGEGVPQAMGRAISRAVKLAVG